MEKKGRREENTRKDVELQEGKMKGKKRMSCRAKSRV